MQTEPAEPCPGRFEDSSLRKNQFPGLTLTFHTVDNYSQPHSHAQSAARGVRFPDSGRPSGDTGDEEEFAGENRRGRCGEIQLDFVLISLK